MDNTNPGFRSQRSIWAGVVILCAGVLILLHRIGVYIPGWIFTWEVFLIAIGVFIGVRRGFRDMTSVIMIFIGLLFLARHEGLIPFSVSKFIWPVAIIVAGILIIVRPKRAFRWGGSMYAGMDSRENVDNDFLDSVAVFWGARRNILSKNFKKGDVVNIFGGTELNFTQADITETAVLDIVAIFGGVKIIVPSDWDVRINVVHIFGGTDDKRAVQPSLNNKKVLVLTGTVMFGGIDVRSY
jgi:predicted membrane protein